MFRQPDNVPRISLLYFSRQIPRQLIQLLFEKAAIAIRRVSIAASHQVPQPEDQKQIAIHAPPRFITQ
jgi:hypothetical protein